MIVPYTSMYARATGQNLLPPLATMDSPLSMGTLAPDGSPDVPSSSSTEGSPLWPGWSLMITAHRNASTSVIAPRMRNTSLHPTASASRLRGPEAAMAPTFPTAMTTPLSAA